MKYLFELLLVVLCLNVARAMPMATPVVVPARVEVSQMPMAAVSPIEPAKPKTAKKIPLRPLARPQGEEAWDWFSIFVPIHFFIIFPLSLALLVLGIGFIAWWWGLVVSALFVIGAWINIYMSIVQEIEFRGIATDMVLVAILSLVMMVIVGLLVLFLGISYAIMGYVIIGWIILGIFLLFLLFVAFLLVLYEINN